MAASTWDECSIGTEPSGVFSGEIRRNLIYIPMVKSTLFCFALASSIFLWGCSSSGSRPTADRDDVNAEPNRTPTGYGERMVEVTPTPRPSVTPTGMIDQPVDPTGRPISTPGSH